jgi:hypothetical protein
MSSIAAQALIPLSKYQERRPTLFPSVHSLQWFVRQHRAELVAMGALLIVGGRSTVNESAFDSVVVEVGQRTAAANVRVPVDGVDFVAAREP